MSQRRAFINARLVDPASDTDCDGGLVVENGRIADVGPHLSDAAFSDDTDIIDCDGHVLAPGLVDLRVFVGEPGAEHRETLATASQAAAAGGVTTFVVMPNTDPVIDDLALVDYIQRRARDTACVHVHTMAALTKGTRGEEMSEMGLLVEAGAVGLTDGIRAVTNAQVMRRALSYATNFDTLIVQHAEDPDLSDHGVMNEGEVATRLGLTGIPAAAESIMIARDLALVELTGGRYHVSQISSSRSVDLIRDAKAKGLEITCGVSAAHLALNELDIGSYRTFFKVSPPLRNETDRLALLSAVADGTIDVIVSSHDPQDAETKRLPFADAAYGAVGLETLLPVALEIFHNGHMDLIDILRPLTIGPADVIGIDAGTLEKGAAADLTLIDLHCPWVLSLAELQSKSKNSPFDGHRFQGRAAMTVVAGQTVFDLRSEEEDF